MSRAMARGRPSATLTLHQLVLLVVGVHSHDVAALVLSITDWWYSCVPWEKFIRTGIVRASVLRPSSHEDVPMFTPVSRSFMIIATLFVLGPAKPSQRCSLLRAAAARRTDGCDDGRLSHAARQRQVRQGGGRTNLAQELARRNLRRDVERGEPLELGVDLHAPKRPSVRRLGNDEGPRCVARWGSADTGTARTASVLSMAAVLGGGQD